MLVFFAFLLCLVWGSASTLFWIPEEELGRGYFQMNALVILGLLSLAVASRLLHPFEPFASAPVVGATALYTASAGALLYYGLVWRQAWSLVRWAAALVVGALGVGLWVLAPGLLAPTVVAPPHQLSLARVALFSSALLLGWGLVTMLLGHWYLVAPKLRFRHLTVFCWVLLGAVGLKLGAFAASLLAAAAVDPLLSPHPWRLLTTLSGDGMFFWIRVLWGLAGPLLLGVMSLTCARRGSNQSATGILYVLVVGTFVGEITAYYLTLTTGVPV
ncbi:MAG: hypothetical protein R3244_00200 [Thermoanaerobaculia bacterium]|nr:hypothetical protein [Thermoanaerobaculia bacterium]